MHLLILQSLLAAALAGQSVECLAGDAACTSGDDDDSTLLSLTASVRHTTADTRGDVYCNPQLTDPAQFCPDGTKCADLEGCDPTDPRCLCPSATTAKKQDGPGHFASFVAEDATLKVEGHKGKTSHGTLMLSGPSVSVGKLFADRPMRTVSPLKASLFAKEFKKVFSTGPTTEDYPNAVLAGRVEGVGTMKQMVIVLTSATYSDNTLTFTWTRNDDISDIDLTSSSLFIDSFGSIFCTLRHPEAYVDFKLCDGLVPKILKKGLKTGIKEFSCVTEDLEGLGLCAAIDVEDAELLTPFCEGAVMVVCNRIVNAIEDQFIKTLSNGTASNPKQACAAMGYKNPCSVSSNSTLL